MNDESVDGAPTPSGRTLLGATEWLGETEERAHAMKNCLSVIDAISVLLERELTVTGRARLERLRAASARLLALVHEELLPTDPERREATTSSLDVPALFESVRTSLCDRAEAAGVSFVVHCEDASVVGIASQLEEALFNLVANAIEASPAGGSVEFTARVDADGDHVWTVQDAGAGMPRHVLERAGKVRRTGREGGSGLGIAIASAVARAHGGLLNIASEERRGTAVTVWLPAADRESYIGEIRRRDEGREPR